MVFFNTTYNKYYINLLIFDRPETASKGPFKTSKKYQTLLSSDTTVGKITSFTKV